ncbi:MAG: hypothetical protein AUG07_03075 [Acidobacteria bacterium 13_1_20CM_2_60_10]|nr:MAG: hypothetical protein AUG07_03075 [Acidobacteria bacterium 13_1_20CM_2_60_10]
MGKKIRMESFSFTDREGEEKGPVKTMSRRAVLVLSLLCLFSATALAQLSSVGLLPTPPPPLSSPPIVGVNRFIVRDPAGLASIQNVCVVLGCNVSGGLDGSLGQLFLVTTPLFVDPSAFLGFLRSQPAVANAELDALLHVRQASGATPPPGLYDKSPVSYFGATVWNGYVSQPAAQIINLPLTQSTFSVTGSGIVAVIDTGVDPTNPVLSSVLVSGYDFTRNLQGGSERGDVTQSSMAVLDQTQPILVNQSSMAVLDQNTATMLQNPSYAAFGHGTMVSGIIHLVAPTAQIMPLKAFAADGSGYTSDVLRAIYYAVQNGANILSMSFSFPTYSQEMMRAARFANRKGVIAVASAGNDGSANWVYPAGYVNLVMGIASTANDDTRSSFSNYGEDYIWVAAPGEGIITTYPFGTYAAGWGTSFSAPFVAAGAALLRSVQPNLNEQMAAQALSHAKWISPDLGNGRVDLFQAVTACRASGTCN